MTLQERVKKIFAEHNINYDCDYNCNAQQVIITIINGDWKHDHRLLQNVMEQNGFECVKNYLNRFIKELKNNFLRKFIIQINLKNMTLCLRVFIKNI